MRAIRAVILTVAMLAGSCAPVQAPQVRPKVGVFLVPLSAVDSDLVCAETPINIPWHDCVTVGQFRSVANSQRAEP
jgi:hypothetical protein